VDLDGVDILMVTALINEAPRAYQIARLAKECHPGIVTIGGGPQMSPLPEEAMTYGDFDVIVNREGEDIIGQLCDVLLEYGKLQLLSYYLRRIPGISFMEDGCLVQTERKGLIDSDFVELPDFLSIKDLTPKMPMAGGVIETVRGCTEKCTYCQVIQQFLGYRVISREVEGKRLKQLHELAEAGLIYVRSDGSFATFVSDDLHTPASRASKFRDERLARMETWRDYTQDMYLTCQVRAEMAQDEEMVKAAQDANIKMLYVGVESNNASNLLAVGKRQEPGQMDRDLQLLIREGFVVVAMTIIGLPYDTEQSIMDLADWVTERQAGRPLRSRYQTANLLTPLPATSNWDLQPLDAQGDLLEPDQMRPYHLYTGCQFVHRDERWGMRESRELFDQYSRRLRKVDTLYGRIFRDISGWKPRTEALV
jgi:anaerobic magnesium-protoporphyrin IX monomethyl ester cyclase